MSHIPRQTRSIGPYNNVPMPSNRGVGPDIKEELKRDIFSQSGKDLNYNQKALNISTTTATIPGAGLDTVLIYFDSSRKVSSDRTNGILNFSVPAINNNNPIANCVTIRILPFYFPRMTASTTQPDIWFYKRAFIRVISTGIAVNAVQTTGNSQHHFEFDVGDKTGLTNIAVDMEPISKNEEGGVFRFVTPQSSITDIGFQFLRPLFTTGGKSLTPIQFPTDTFAVTGGPLFTIASPGVTTTEVFSLPPGTIFPFVPPAPGYAVFFSGSGNSTVDSPDGWFVTSVDSNTTFTVPGLPGVGTTSVLVGANRIAFRVEFVCVRTTPTNFTTLTQM